MSYYSPSIEKLIESFERLPSIGHKTAARLAFHILNSSEEETNEFINSIQNAKKNLKYCSICNNITDADPCSICGNAKRDKEVVCVIGPSGSGKSTFIRCLNLLEVPTSGQIFFDGQDVAKLPPHKRRINTVFQKYALFPHLDVYDNVAFGLKLKKIPYEVTDKNGNKVYTTDVIVEGWEFVESGNKEETPAPAETANDDFLFHRITHLFYLRVSYF